MFKNVASQQIVLLAIDTATNTPKTGDAANITAYLSKDYGTVTALGDTSATEMDATNAPGLYKFDVTQTESNCDVAVFSAKSSTSGIRIIPVTVFMRPANATALSIDSSGRVDVIKINGTSQTARDIGASVLLSPGTGTGQISLSSGAVTAGTVSDKTGYSLATAPPTASQISTQVMTDLGTGSALTSLAPASTALSTATWTATIAGRIDATISSRLASASYSAPPSAATISSQVQADLGTGSALTALAPAATALSTVVWTPTMAGYLDAAVSSRLASASYTAPLDASGVRTAVGLASANLDTQLDALPTAAENSTAVWAAVTRSLTDKAGFSLATAPPTADENAAALLDLANAIESGLTVRQAMRLIVAADAGKVSGGGTTTVTIRDIADTKDRIVATVDSDGNRTAITRDLT